MCFGDGVDTLRSEEQVLLRAAAKKGFPNHCFSICHGDDGLVWAVLAPHISNQSGLRFTICRIDPCLMIMVEDPDARRQFRAASTVEDAMAFIQGISEQAFHHAANAHPAPRAMQ